MFKEEGFKLKDLDFDALESLMEGMKQNVYNIAGKIKENAVFEATYLNLIDYMKKDVDYGTYFASYYDSYANPYDVDWHKLLVAVKIADDLKSTGSISPSDLNKVADIASTSEAIADAVKDAVKDKIANEELKTKVDSLNLADESTLKPLRMSQKWQIRFKNSVLNNQQLGKMQNHSSIVSTIKPTKKLLTPLLALLTMSQNLKWWKMQQKFRLAKKKQSRKILTMLLVLAMKQKIV